MRGLQHLENKKEGCMHYAFSWSSNRNNDQKQMECAAFLALYAIKAYNRHEVVGVRQDRFWEHLTYTG